MFRYFHTHTHPPSLPITLVPHVNVVYVMLCSDCDRRSVMSLDGRV